MASSTQIPTAKIYQFPVRAKTATGVRHDANSKRPVPEYGDCGSSGAWYHEAAIIERDVAPKR